MHFLFFLLYTKLHCLLQVSSQTEHCSLPCSRGCVILVEPVCPRFPFSPLCLPSCLQLLLVGVLQLLSPMLMKYRAWKIAFAVPMRELGECWWVVGGNLCILWDSSHSPDEVHWEAPPPYDGSVASVLWCVTLWKLLFLLSSENWAKPSVSFILYLKPLDWNL